MLNSRSWLMAVLAGMVVLTSSLLFYAPRSLPFRSEAVVPAPAGSGRRVDREPARTPNHGVQQEQPLTVGPDAPVQQVEREPRTADPVQQQKHATEDPAAVQQTADPEVPRQTRMQKKSNWRDQPDLVKFNDGFQLLLQGKYADAEAAFLRVIQEHAQAEYGDDALYWLGYAQAEQAHDDAALGTFGTLVDRHPDSPYADDALLKCGLIHQRHGETELAERCYQRALKLYPDSEATLSCAQNLATLQEVRGDWKNAENSWSVSESQAEKQLGQEDNYYGNRARNRKTFIQANCDNEGRPLDLFNRGEVLLTEGKVAEAIVCFESVLRDYPESPLCEAARFKAGLCYQALGQWDRAVGSLNAVVRTATDPAIKESARKALEEVRRVQTEGAAGQESRQAK